MLTLVDNDIAIPQIIVPDMLVLYHKVVSVFVSLSYNTTIVAGRHVLCTVSKDG